MGCDLVIQNNCCVGLVQNLKKCMLTTKQNSESPQVFSAIVSEDNDKSPGSSTPQCNDQTLGHVLIDYYFFITCLLPGSSSLWSLVHHQKTQTLSLLLLAQTPEVGDASKKTFKDQLICLTLISDVSRTTSTFLLMSGP